MMSTAINLGAAKRNDRRPTQEMIRLARMHLAWRWFTGLGFDQEIPAPLYVFQEPVSTIPEIESVSAENRQPQEAWESWQNYIWEPTIKRP